MDSNINSNFNINKFNSANLQKTGNVNAGKTIQNSSVNSFANHLNIADSLNRIAGNGHNNLISSTNFLGNEKVMYMKELMNLPKEMKDILVLIQNATQGSTAKELSKLMSANINFASLAEIMQKNGKEAISKLITAMTEMSKQGVDTSTLKDAMKLINASISVSGQESQTQAVKTLMLLYLPWLPLHEGKDFELDIDLSEKSCGDDAIMNILIATVNYGNINISIITKTKGSFDVLIKCVKDFPQKELKEKMLEDNKKYSIKSDLIFEELTDKSEEKKNHQVKVTMTNLKDVCAYLLSLSNNLIRNIILIDKT